MTLAVASQGALALHEMPWLAVQNQDSPVAVVWAVENFPMVTMAASEAVPVLQLDSTPLAPEAAAWADPFQLYVVEV